MNTGADISQVKFSSSEVLNITHSGRDTSAIFQLNSFVDCNITGTKSIPLSCAKSNVTSPISVSLLWIDTKVIIHVSYHNPWR